MTRLDNKSIELFSTSAYNHYREGWDVPLLKSIAESNLVIMELLIRLNNAKIDNKTGNILDYKG